MRVISVISGKGGVGKTTLVANLGVVLASKFKKNVILIDCNITTSHLGLYMGIHQHQTTLNDIIKKEADTQDAIYTHASGAKIIPASLALKDLDGVDMLHLKAAIKQIQKDYPETDYILLDCAPGFGREAMAGLRSGEEVLYITTPYFPVVVDLVKCKHVAEELDLKNIGTVINMANKSKHELTKTEIENITELPTIGTIPMHKSVFKSLHKRIPITSISPHSKVSRQFTKIASIITGEKIPKNDVFDVIFQIMD